MASVNREVAKWFWENMMRRHRQVSFNTHTQTFHVCECDVCLGREAVADLEIHAGLYLDEDSIQLEALDADIARGINDLEKGPYR